MPTFTPDELQKLVLMVGSKKELGTYLGLDPKQTDELWTRSGLKTPLSWLRDQPEAEQHRLLARAGSLKLLAKRLGCSEAALRPIYLGEPTRDLNWELERVLALFDRYGSVRTVAHMTDATESLVRREVERHQLDLTDLLDYSNGNNANAKGRRAEIEFARLRGDRITGDRNKLDGSQATHDFDDQDFGRVNVKSSRQYRYRAQSRQGSPEFYKFSNRGHANADTLILMAYDRKMESLVGVLKISTSDPRCQKTLLVTKDQLEPVDGLLPCL